MRHDDRYEYDARARALILFGSLGLLFAGVMFGVGVAVDSLTASAALCWPAIPIATLGLALVLVGQQAPDRPEPADPRVHPPVRLPPGGRGPAAVQDDDQRCAACGRPLGPLGLCPGVPDLCPPRAPRTRTRPDPAGAGEEVAGGLLRARRLLSSRTMHGG